MLVEVIGAGPRAAQRRDEILQAFADVLDAENAAASRRGLIGRFRSPHDPFAIAGAVCELVSRQVRLGVPAGVVGWPAARPAAGEADFALAEGVFRREAPEPGSAWPTTLAGLSGRAAAARPSRQEVDLAIRSRFGGRVPAALADSLTADLWRQRITQSLAGEDRRAEALFLLLPGLREVSHRWFGGFNAVQFEGEAGLAGARADAERVAAYYAWLDDLLEAAWERQSGPRLLAVVSAYGVTPRGGWHRMWGQMAPGTAVGGEFQDGPDGVVMLYGEGIRPGALLTGARLVDVAPTLIYALGFPVSRDLDGKVLTAAFDHGFLQRNPVSFFPSYEGLARARGSAILPAPR